MSLPRLFLLFFLFFSAGAHAQIPELQKASEKGRSQVFGNQLTNQVQVLFPDSSLYQKNSYKLMDGKKSKALENSTAWFRSFSDSLVLDFNLNEARSIDTIEIYYLMNQEKHIFPPDSLWIQYEENEMSRVEKFTFNNGGSMNLTFINRSVFPLSHTVELSYFRLIFFSNENTHTFLMDEITF